MRLFACLCLCIFTTGNLLSEVRGDCGGTVDAHGERSGSILYTFPSALNNLTNDQTLNSGTEQWPNFTCTWTINAQDNQTVWIKVVYVDKDTSLRIKFHNETVGDKQKTGALFTCTGRTVVEWRWRNGTNDLRKLHLRWNTSEDGHDLAHVPYTHSDNDPVSPSPDTPNRVTRASDILGVGSVSTSEHTLRRGVNVQQGGGVPGSDDKDGPPIPQEGTHNGQERPGTAISDLAHSVTHSGTDPHTRSSLSYTHANSHMVTETVPTLAPSSTKIQLERVSTHTLAGNYDVATATSAYSEREIDKTYSGTHTKSLPKHSPPTVQHTVTKIYTDRHNSTEGTLLNSAVPEANSKTIGPFESVTDNEASEIVSKIQTLYGVTKSDVSMATSTDRGISMVTTNQPYVTALANTPNSRSAETEMDQTNRSLRSTRAHPDIFNQTHSSVFDDRNTVSGSPAVVTQINMHTFSHQDSSSRAGASESPFLREDTSLAEHHTNIPYEALTTQPTSTKNSLDLTSTHIESEHTRPMIAQHSTFTFSPSTSRSIDTIPPFIPTTPSDLPLTSGTLVEALTEEGRNSSPTLASHVSTTMKPDGEKEMNSTTFASSSIFPFVITTSEVRPRITPDLMMQGTDVTEVAENNTREQESDTATSFTFNTVTHSESPEKQSYTHKQQNPLLHTLSPTHITEINTTIPQSTNFPQTEHTSNDISHANSSQSSVSLSPVIPVDISPSISIATGSIEATHSITARPTWPVRNDPVTPKTHSSVISVSSAISTAGEAVSTSTSSQWGTSQAPVENPLLKTTERPKITPTLNSNHPTTSRNTPVHQTHVPVQQASTPTPRVQINTNSYQSQTTSHTPLTPTFTQTSQLFPGKTDKMDRDWSHKRRVFIAEDQPTIIKVETFEVLVQVVLEENSPSYVRLVEMEPFLHRVAGYQSQQVTWHNGPVLQTVVTFRTVEALPWLGRVESLLQEAGLSPLPREGVFVGGVRVKNITVGGLHTDVCSWLFMCPSGFQCVSSEGNASCRSICHSEYCKHQGICVHRHGQQPLCQCPVGEDFWFMGPRCDLRMTRQRLVGVCFGVLLAVAVLMAVLSYLAVRRFKSMLLQAKVDQTRSSYRRFNHFDELSARFWGRSWPGSEDSLDNPAFTRSDELLHMRTLDRTCCYHDDTLSIASTYQDSMSHLNTVYPHSSQYRWDLSNYSLADCVVDSGKASDLSVCSWPIEPIQWTPFPLLQQLSKNTASVKASRPRSYCEGMELVDLEKSWTA